LPSPSRSASVVCILAAALLVIKVSVIGSLKYAVRSHGRLANTSCTGVRQQSIATQNWPLPLERTLSGKPGRFANTSSSPVLGPSSQYLIILQFVVSEKRRNCWSSDICTPFGKTNPFSTTWAALVSGSYLSSLPVPSPSSRMFKWSLQKRGLVT
jgi:hypothetical protein